MFGAAEGGIGCRLTGRRRKAFKIQQTGAAEGGRGCRFEFLTPGKNPIKPKGLIGTNDLCVATVSNLKWHNGLNSKNRSNNMSNNNNSNNDNDNNDKTNNNINNLKSMAAPIQPFIDL